MDMVQTITGLLSGSTRVSRVAQLPVSTIVAAYRRRLGIDVAAYFGDLRELAFLRDEESGLLFFHPLTPGPEHFYAELSTRFDWYYKPHKRAFDVAREHIKPSDDVLEIGAGLGFFRDGTLCKSYTGIETNTAAVRSARDRGLELASIDIRALARDRPQSFDVVCAFQVIEHVDDPRAFIAAMIELTRARGRIVISTPSADGFWARSRDALNVPPHHVTWWPDQTWYWIRDAFSLRTVTLFSNPRERVLDWSRTLAINGLAKIRGITLQPILDESPGYLQLAELAEQSAQIIAHGVQAESDIPARGHSVIAVFEK
ncbi:MAG: class I SAM-dependent methyltransferase [Stellaceae bacterium]